MDDTDRKPERRHAPAAERNREPLLEVLRPRLGGPVLEIASGTGQHARYFTDHLDVQWQPTDLEQENLESIEAWRAGGREHLLAPKRLDVHDRPWPVSDVHTVLAVNLVHISPWSATEALFAGASEVGAAQVVTYGPYRIGGSHTSPSNERFEAWLHSLDPRYGVRNLEALAEVARLQGFALAERLAMPANNFTLVFRKA